MKQYVVDAFAEELFTGNPAAVLPCRKMPSGEIMQKIAIENNYSETAFVVKKETGRYDLKWFTPGSEVKLCGHATLATAFVLTQFAYPGEDTLRFDTLSGELTVTRDGEYYTLNFPKGNLERIPVDQAILRASNDLAKEAYRNNGTVLVLIECEEQLKAFQPDAEAIIPLGDQGMIVTAPSSAYDFVSRCFYPALGVLEDPVTGSAHTFLGPFWAERLKKETLLAKQISPRGGVLKVRPVGDRVAISGKAKLFMAGDIPFDL